MKAVLIERPLWWHLLGLQQTASGYGSKLATRYALDCEDGKRRRLYCICYSNAGSLYVIIKGERWYMFDHCSQPGETVTLEPPRRQAVTL